MWGLHALWTTPGTFLQFCFRDSHPCILADLGFPPHHSCSLGLSPLNMLIQGPCTQASSSPLYKVSKSIALCLLGFDITGLPLLRIRPVRTNYHPWDCDPPVGLGHIQGLQTMGKFQGLLPKGLCPTCLLSHTLPTRSGRPCFTVMVATI
jgi:hypothetical protein